MPPVSGSRREDLDYGIVVDRLYLLLSPLNGQVCTRHATQHERSFLQSSGLSSLSHLPRISTMETEPQRPKEKEGVVSMLNGFIEAFNLAKEISSNTPAKAVFGSVNVLLVMIRMSLPALRRSNTDLARRVQDTMINKVDYVELGLACGEVCAALKRGLDEKSEDQLNDSVLDAIKRLRT